LRRHAAHGVGDAAINQRQAVIGALLVMAGGEAEFYQRGVEQQARIIAGERAARTVRAAHAGGETDDQQLRVESPETGDWRVMPGRFLCAVISPVLRQARAKRAVMRWNHS
jgi:hypothetical protein